MFPRHLTYYFFCWFKLLNYYNTRHCINLTVNIVSIHFHYTKSDYTPSILWCVYSQYTVECILPVYVYSEYTVVCILPVYYGMYTPSILNLVQSFEVKFYRKFIDFISYFVILYLFYRTNYPLFSNSYYNYHVIKNIVSSSSLWHETHSCKYFK